MDIIIGFLLALIATLLLIQRPIRIQIEHKYPTHAVEEPKTQTEKEIEEQPVINMDSFINNLHEIMGVNQDGRDRNYNIPT